MSAPIVVAQLEAAMASVDELVAHARKLSGGAPDSAIMLLVGALIVSIGDLSADLARVTSPEDAEGGPVRVFARRLYAAEMFGAVFSTLELARTAMAPRTDTKPAVPS